MKTAEYIASAIADGTIGPYERERFIKEYAIQVALATLEEASEKVGTFSIFEGGSEREKVKQRRMFAVMSVPIITP